MRLASNKQKNMKLEMVEEQGVIGVELQNVMIVEEHGLIGVSLQNLMIVEEHGLMCQSAEL